MCAALCSVLLETQPQADFSVLLYADTVKNAEAFNTNPTMQYRLDALAFGRWGGVWTVPSSYSFVATNNLQVLKHFDAWSFPWTLTRRPMLAIPIRCLTTGCKFLFS